MVQISFAKSYGILEDVAVIISDLSAEQTKEVLSAVTSTLTALLPLDSMKFSFYGAIEKQRALLHGLMIMSEENQEECAGCLENDFCF